MSENNPRNSDMRFQEVYFWTSTILNWKHLLNQDNFKQIIVDSLKTLVERKCISVFGFVIMPNHVHLLWEHHQLNQKEMPDNSFSKFTAHQFQKELRLNQPGFFEEFFVGKKDRKYQFWQRDPLAIEISNRDMLNQKLDYIHFNPMSGRWNLVQRPEAYQWSSASFYETGKDDFGILTHFMDRI